MSLEKNIKKASVMELKTLIRHLDGLELWDKNNIDIVRSINYMLVCEIAVRC